VNTVKKPDLLVLVAIWEFITALLVMIPMAALCAVIFGNLLDWRDWAGGWDLPKVPVLVNIAVGFVLVLFFAYLVLAVMGGVWLLQRNEMGRLISIVHAALSLLWVPIGTVAGALVLVYLTRPEVRDYFHADRG
jgi:hypothetical protein